MEKHGIVYAEPGMYAGWPANHGAWQWGDEMLVGFLRGRYKRKSMHNIAAPFEKVHARSLDGGRTWNVELPGVDFDPKWTMGDTPVFDLLERDTIVRVCGVYDHGGDECVEAGAFYLSAARGRPGSWKGPFPFNGLEDRFPNGKILNTSRTRTVGNLFFLSEGQALMWGTDSTFCAWWSGAEFVTVGVVCDDRARAVMPAVAELPTIDADRPRRLVCLLRRRMTGKRGGWIEAFASDNEGNTWFGLGQVGPTGGHNGNPPALLALPDGRLVAAYGNRDYGCMMQAVSNDRGVSWTTSLLREAFGEQRDIGYPQLFLRSDGVPICVYYWTDAEHPEQHIAWSEVECVDPIPNFSRF